MTIMNGRIRQDLTDLLADALYNAHVQRMIKGVGYPTSMSMWDLVAEDAMDFIYGGEDDPVPQPECAPVQEARTRPGDQGPDGGTVCCNGFTCGCCPGSVDRLEGGPVVAHQCFPGCCELYGVMNPAEPLVASFVALDHPSPTAGYVRLRESGYVPKPQSPQGSDSTV